MAQTTAKVKVFWDSSRGFYLVDFLGSKGPSGFFSVIKAAIPFDDRIEVKLSNGNIIYGIGETSFPILENIILKFFHSNEYILIRKPAESTQRSSMSNTALAAETFLRSIPYEYIRRAYLQASTELHPDKGGDSTRMAMLNTSWNEVKKEIYGQ